MENELNKILPKLKELLPFIKEKYHVSSIEIFGSFVKDEQQSGSDLDLLVTFSVIPGLIKFLELKNYLTDQLQINVDLVMKDSLKPRLSDKILDESIRV